MSTKLVFRLLGQIIDLIRAVVATLTSIDQRLKEQDRRLRDDGPTFVEGPVPPPRGSHPVHNSSVSDTTEQYVALELTFFTYSHFFLLCALPLPPQQ